MSLLDDVSRDSMKLLSFNTSTVARTGSRAVLGCPQCRAGHGKEGNRTGLILGKGRGLP